LHLRHHRLEVGLLAEASAGQWRTAAANWERIRALVAEHTVPPVRACPFIRMSRSPFLSPAPLDRRSGIPGRAQGVA
jgi:hypothetical protein